MTNLFLVLFSAFSFLMPKSGMLTRNMGFIGYNPAEIKSNMMVIMGRLGALDSKEAVVEISLRNTYIRTAYHSFGELMVRGNIPQDNEFVSSYPYLFTLETGGNLILTPGAKIGASLLYFEQRVMTEDVKGFAVNLGMEYSHSKFSLGGYVRNIGPRVGYISSEKYALPLTASSYLVYRQLSGIISCTVDVPNMSVPQSTFSFGYIRKISNYFYLGGEITFERDFSLGNQVKYPLKLMLQGKRDRYSIGYLVDIPSGGFNLRNTIYLGVGL